MKTTAKSILDDAFMGATAILIGGILLTVADRAISHVIASHWKQSFSMASVIALAAGNVTFLACIGLVALALVALSFVLRRVAGSERVTPSLVLSLSAAIGTSALLYWTGLDLSSGEWISGQRYSWLFLWVPTVLGAICGFGVVRLAFAFSPQENRSPGASAAMTAAFFVATFAIAWLNAVLWFSLYPRLHVAFYALSSLLALCGCVRALAMATRGLSKRFVHLSGAIAMALAVGLAPFWFGMDRRTRSELVTSALTATDIIRLYTGSVQNRTALHEALAFIELDCADRLEEASLPRGLIHVPADYNVVLIVSDATRADALPPSRQPGQAHAKDGDTPFLDEWLSRSIRFRTVYSQAANTRRSMPILFRSLEVEEDPEKLGIPLGTFMSSLGRTTIAVVTNLFTEPRRKLYNDLLIGFEHVDSYEETDMDSQVPKTLGMIDSIKNRPFFAWFHFYCMHIPGYADGHRLTSKDGPGQSRYRKSLRWLDGEMKKLIAGFEERKLMEKTVFVFAADHGQSLGERQGGTDSTQVWDSVVRVPLAFWIPGEPPRLIDGPIVGNIDIVPTIADLLGAPLDPQHRGRSLVPLMRDPSTPWRGEYFVKARRGEVIGFVRKRQKLVYDIDAEAIYLFDLARDPQETENLFNIGNKRDLSMLRRIVNRSPERFSTDLEDEATEFLLSTRLREVSESTSAADLDFLLKLAALDENPAVRAEADRIFDRRQDLDGRLAVVKHFFDLDQKKWSLRLVQLLREAASRSEEAEVVERLAYQGQTEFSPRFVADRLAASIGDPSAWKPWLLLIKSWPKKRGSALEPVLHAMLDEAFAAITAGPPSRDASDHPLDADALEMLLDDVAAVKTDDDRRLRRTRTAALRFLEYGDARVERAACRVLGTHGAEAESASLRVLFEDKTRALQVRREALHSIAAIEGEASLPVIVKAGEDLLFTLDAIQIIRDAEFLEGIGFLDRVAKKHYHWHIRDQAESAAKKLKKLKKRKRAR